MSFYKTSVLACLPQLSVVSCTYLHLGPVFPSPIKLTLIFDYVIGD